MQLFVNTVHCTSRAHCKLCRDKTGGRWWREDLKKIVSLPNNDADFTCPYGVPWNGQTPSNPASAALVKQRASGTRTTSGCGSCNRK